MSGADAELYPIFLKLAGRRVLVAGAGAIATRKVVSLVEAQAMVCVVAPQASDEVKRLARQRAIEWRARPFQSGDGEGAWLILAATSDGAAQRAIAAEAQARRVFVIAVDDPPNATAYSGSIVRRPPFTIAISSSGAAPALTRLVREILEHVLPADEWIEHARRLRARWAESAMPPADRFGDLVREIAARTR
jgi:siroheme synthase-like protein